MFPKAAALSQHQAKPIGNVEVRFYGSGTPNKMETIDLLHVLAALT
jgi:hypothetical protein